MRRSAAVNDPNPTIFEPTFEQPTNMHTNTQLKHVRDTGQQVEPGVNFLIFALCVHNKRVNCQRNLCYDNLDINLNS